MRRERKTAFRMPYAGIDIYNGLYILYGDKGDLSMLLHINNPVLQYSADPDAYASYQNLLLNIIKILGEGHIVQKQDVFIRRNYKPVAAEDFLQQKYHAHFEGREYTEIKTYLVITRQVRRGAFYTYNKKVLVDFFQNIHKIFELLSSAGLNPNYLTEAEINRYVTKVLSMDFSSAHTTLNNMRCDDEQLNMGDIAIRCMTIVNTDSVDLPDKVGSYIEKQDHPDMRSFPVDNLAFLHHVPGYRVIMYNQVIEIPSQQMTLNQLELKRKRHSGVPDPANLICVEDIDLLLVDVARDNQLLVKAHFSMIVCAEDSKIRAAVNYVEAALFQQGIIPSRNAYNQLELFRCALPGNAVELKKYDWFLTTADAALCFFFKESLLKDENSSFLIRFTDRQGVPVGIDPADLPMRTNRINNRNKFVLGPSGSGKSFFMNALIEQYMLYNMDIVIVDTGDSYPGICRHFKGKYITWSESKPITMNPFAITESEYNIEKKDFLNTLISLLWKGAEGKVSSVEHDVISNVISAYYSRFFNPDYPGLSTKQLFDIRKRVFERMKDDFLLDLDPLEVEEVLMINKVSDMDEVLLSDESNVSPFQIAFNQNYAVALREEERLDIARHERLRTHKLDFNSFYEFALWKIPEIKAEERISFDLDEFRYVLKKFYSGGEFESILNESSDASLFSERFIVFEIDAIKENRILFPIVTLIIMDVFIQKMRHRRDQRKALIIEEAWKAIASPLMASYILYLYKTVRKFWGEAIVVTQELGDILGNAVVKDSILNNSDTTCLLDQSKFKENYKEISKLLSITEIEQKKIFTINKLDNTDNRGRFKEVYIRRGASGEVYGIEVSIFQYLAYTTEKPEKSAVERYAQFYGTYQSALEAFVSHFNQSGLSLEAFVSKVNRYGVVDSNSIEYFKPDFS